MSFWLSYLVFVRAGLWHWLHEVSESLRQTSLQLHVTQTFKGMCLESYGSAWHTLTIYISHVCLGVGCVVKFRHRGYAHNHSLFHVPLFLESPHTPGVLHTAFHKVDGWRSGWGRVLLHHWSSRDSLLGSPPPQRSPGAWPQPRHPPPSHPDPPVGMHSAGLSATQASATSVIQLPSWRFQALPLLSGIYMYFDEKERAPILSVNHTHRHSLSHSLSLALCVCLSLSFSLCLYVCPAVSVSVGLVLPQ